VNVKKTQSLTRNVNLKVGKMMDLTVLHVESPTAVYICPVLSELKDCESNPLLLLPLVKPQPSDGGWLKMVQRPTNMDLIGRRNLE
jgi:hypothetical protein